METNIETPLPWKQIGVLMAVRASEPIASSILSPFVYFMVRDFGITNNDKQIGYYIGFIATSFAVAQIISVYPWGILSDRIGRRPVLLLGLIGTAVNLFLFGLSKSLPWAMVTRSLCGLLNGNVAVVKTMMGELTDKSNRAKGFSLLPLVVGLGQVLGPVMGGFLCNPVDKFPSLFSDGAVRDFFLKYPYFLPCGISSILLLCSSLFGFFFLKETLEPPVSNEILGSSTTSLLRDRSGHSDYGALASPPSPTSNLPPGIGLIILGFSGQTLQQVMQGQLFTLWAASPQSIGGLGFSPSNIGSVLAFGGVALFAIQIFGFTPIQKKLGTLKLYKTTFMIFPIIMCSYPLIPLIRPINDMLFWFSLLTLNSCRIACSVFAATSINLLIVEQCPDRSILGRINGLAQSTRSIMRAIGPILCGTLFAWSLSNSYSLPIFHAPFTWFVIASIACINYNIASRIPPSK